MHLRLSRIFCLVLALACVPAIASEPVVPHDAPVLHPRDMAPRFNALYNAGELDQLIQLFEPDAVLRVGDAEPVRGRDAIRAALAGFIAPGAVMETTQADVVENNGVAYVATRWRIHGTLEMQGASREVLRRQPDGRWLYAIDLPAPET